MPHTSHPLLIKDSHLSIPAVMERLKATRSGMLIVVDDQNRFLGVITQRDLHRALLNGKANFDEILHTQAPVLTPQALDSGMAKFPKSRRKFVPIVNEKNQVESVLELAPNQLYTRPQPVVIMAGGLGKRLGELTENLPKPMLPLGHQPVLHFILESLAEYGFVDFFLCVNYRAEVIKEYFGSGEGLGINIRYVEEDEPLGTAGALGLIEEPMTEPVLVMNGDLITSLNFESLMDFHLEKEATATMCLAEYNYQLPFGVVHTRNSSVLSLHEKPYQQHYINAGIYVLNRRALEFIEPGKPKDMTSVFEDLLKADEAVHAYHINEFWLDIGHRQDYERGKRIFSQ